MDIYYSESLCFDDILFNFTWEIFYCSILRHKRGDFSETVNELAKISLSIFIFFTVFF